MKKITLSTFITLVRIILTPVIVVAMSLGYWSVAFLMFGVAAWSDVVDGALARWLNEQTFLGACLDALADKLLTLSIFFTLAFVQSPLFSLPCWFVWLVLIKELILIGGATVIYSVRGNLMIAPTKLGKATTFLQLLFIFWLFACYFFKWVPIKTYYAMLCLMMILVILTLFDYVRIGLKQFRLLI